MLRLVRWKYVVPRVTIVVVICLTVWLTKNFALRYALIHAGQAMTGAKVEINLLESFVSRAELHASGIAVADPRKPMQNLFETETSQFDIDTSELLRKRFVVNQGRLSGIVLDTPRQTSGELPAVPRPPEEQTGPTWSDKILDVGDQWVEGAEERFKKQLDVELQTVQVGRELMERWPREYQTLEQQSREIRQRGENVAELIRQTKRNPLQAVEHYQQLFQQLETLKQDAQQVRGRMQQIRQQMQLDRQNVALAKQHDAEFVKKHRELSKLDPEVWSNYLLGPELGGKAQEVLQWIQWGRQYLPSGDEPNQMAGRGWDVIFPGMKQTPNFLIRELVLDGVGQAGGNPFQFSGNVHGLTSQPAVYGKPAVFNIQTTGSVATLIEGTFDHTGKVPRDSIVIRCPRLMQSGKMLGKADKLAVQVAPGESQLLIQLDLLGDQLQGQIQFVQPSVRLAPRVSSSLGGDLVARRLTTATSNIRDLEAVIHLSGSLRKPALRLQSNLGSQLSSGFQTALQDELASRQQQLLARANQEVDQAVGKLEQQIQAKQDELLQGLNLSSNQLDMVKSELASLGLPTKLLGEGKLLGDGKLIGDGSVLQKLLKRR